MGIQYMYIHVYMKVLHVYRSMYILYNVPEVKAMSLRQLCSVLSPENCFRRVTSAWAHVQNVKFPNDSQ